MTTCPAPPPRILITGGAGLLGSALLRHAPPGMELHATQRHTPLAARAHAVHQLDLADATATRALWAELRPALVFHTAYSMHAGERDILQATQQVLDACRATGSALVHLSTDALFSGDAAPYDERAAPDPVYEYGRWKAAAEHAVAATLPQAAIVRTSLLTCFSPPDPRSAWVAGALRRSEPLALFVDELRCPIAPDDLARQLWELAALPPETRAGVWHLVGPEALSRYALGLLIAAHGRLDPAPLHPTRSADFPTPRPRDLRLLTGRADRHLRTRARPISALLTDR